MTRILYFGKLRDAAGRASQDAAPPSDIATVGQLIAWIGADRPDLADALSQPSVRVAIDQEIAAGPDAPLAGAGEIAFMPPMSGG